ncbi:Metal-dependent hydrolase [Halanaerobium saccharolyticum subsp. saccharolyticum DSM 6643]|uniref:Metal-dependent hydrolase n=1 Tax=Halanaerobium saccharolyticum subsp. saccharolyticum DSM 6643 TaxID=1293054 RepID=M5DZK6_9FIRM|nr:cyclase family protein [Halanaerobium saccharolyticum]CCU78706.1 Metal-dependent hydrolase [Halanaerobium saccharolyticum subsp. saccharolyticum DSM 6643]
MYDISMEIKEDMIVYKNIEDLKPKFKTNLTFENDDVYDSQIEMNLHTGTHIDTPFHRFKNGKKSNDYFEENPFYEAKVLDLSHKKEKITKNDLEKYEIKKNMFIILKTKNSEKNYLKNNPEKFIYLGISGAEYLKNMNISGVGIDTNGIERDQEGAPTHKILLKNNIIILEGLKLNKIPEKEYILLLSLLKVSNREGMPGRAYLFDKKEIDVSNIINDKY